MPITAGQVMDQVAVLVNDPSKNVYTYAKQLPFLRFAYQEVQNKLNLSAHQALAEISGVETILAGETEVADIGGSLAGDVLVEPVRIYERAVGGDDNSWFPMDPAEWEDLREPIEILGSFTWRRGVIKLTPATVDREIKIYYRRVLSAIASEITNLEFPQFRTYLEYRTGALIAGLAMKDLVRAQMLATEAAVALEVAEQTSVKFSQHFPVRSRRRFFQRR